MRRVVAVLAMSVACGGGKKSPHDARQVDGAVDGGVDASPDPNEGAVSGSRIKLVWYQTPDGVRQFVGYHDAQLGDDCAPNDWVDGNTYCTPAAMSPAYSDANCTTLIGLTTPITPGCATNVFPNYVLVGGVPTSGCGSSLAHLYHRGAQLSLTQYYTKGGTTCFGPSPAGSAFIFYAVGAEVTASQLAQLTQSAPSGAGTLQLQSTQTADGMHRVTTAYDTAHADDCNPTDAYTNGPICALQSQYSAYFQDSSCTQNAIGVQTGCPVPSTERVESGSRCPMPSAAFYATGASFSPAYSFTAVCQMASSTGMAYFAAAAQLAPAPLQYQPDIADGLRLAPMHYTAPSFSYRGGLYDRTYHQQVSLALENDGTIVGEPTWYAYVPTQTFSDAACTTPIAIGVVYVGASTCPTTATPTLARGELSDSNGCLEHQFYTLGAIHSGPVYQNLGSCQAFMPQTSVIYDVTPLPAGSLETATRVVDP